MNPAHVSPAQQAAPVAAPPAAGSGTRALIAVSVAAALCLGTLIALAFVGDGKQLETWLAPLAALQAPLTDLSAASRGGDAVDGIEYVVFLRDGASHESLDGFFRTHSDIRFVSPGIIPGIAVVRIRGDVSPSLAALREQPHVMMTLNSRLGMVCH
jgi:hypothetical protein